MSGICIQTDPTIVVNKCISLPHTSLETSAPSKSPCRVFLICNSLLFCRNSCEVAGRKTSFRNWRKFVMYWKTQGAIWEHKRGEWVRCGTDKRQLRLGVGGVRLGDKGGNSWSEFFAQTRTKMLIFVHLWYYNLLTFCVPSSFLFTMLWRRHKGEITSLPFHHPY